MPLPSFPLNSHRRPKKEERPPWPETREKQLEWIWLVYRRNFATAAASGASLMVTYPLDTIKTHMQTNPKYILSGGVAGRGRLFNLPTTQCIMDVARREGARGFYRGIVPPFFTIGVYRLINMGAYRHAKWAVDDVVAKFTEKPPLDMVNEIGSYPNLATTITFTTAGAMAGAVGAFYTSPLELIKYAQQLAGTMAKDTNGSISPADQKLRQSYVRNRSMLGISKVIYQNFGWRGFFIGFKYHFIRDTVGGGFYFGVYEGVKQYLGPSRGRDPAFWGAVSIAGFVCGAVSSMVLFPYDTAKSRYQKMCLSSTIRPAFPQYSWVRNLRINYPGFAITIARSGLTHGLFFLCYETLKRHIELGGAPHD